MRCLVAVWIWALAAPPMAAQQATASVETDRVVVTGIAPFPDVGEGAPRFTAKDVGTIEKELRDAVTASQADYRTCGVPANTKCVLNRGIQELLACEIEYGAKAANLAVAAINATEAAEKARRDTAAGKATVPELIDTELARQEAVNEMQKGRQRFLEVQARMADVQRAASGFQGPDPAHLELKRRQAGWGLGVVQPDIPDGLTITNVRVVQYRDLKKGEFARIEGEIVNSGAKPAKIPGLSATLVDEKGSPLHTLSVAPAKRGNIAPGKSRAFSFDIKPAPDLAERAVVTFASDVAPPPRIKMNGILCPRSAAPQYMQ